MTSTIERPPADQAPSDDHRNRHRIFYVVTVILVLTTVVLAGIVLFDDDSGSGASMPAEVEQVLEDFRDAYGNRDIESLAPLVTPDFRMSEYVGDLEGLNRTQKTEDLEYYENVFGDPRHYLIERNGDPIVVGDGPWYVS